MKRIVVFTGAGMSADSGIPVFRGGNGLWDNVPIEEICTAEAIQHDRLKVIRFYNSLRQKMLACQPNDGHLALVRLEQQYRVEVITQNVDNLHERAGSTHITHLHGELCKLRSSIDETDAVDLDGWEQQPDARHPDGSLLRPFIVFFGEGVPNFPKACDIASTADIFIVIGTSLNVYPAASLLRYVKAGVPVYIVDPNPIDTSGIGSPVEQICERAAVGVPILVDRLMQQQDN
ncbi:MAG: NAD-dependent deacylase [Paludibacteraceae bacterium]|nr:NAD-dependent deacylase [Paludibacteraceae bacterium]